MARIAERSAGDWSLEKQMMEAAETKLQLSVLSPAARDVDSIQGIIAGAG